MKDTLDDFRIDFSIKRQLGFTYNGEEYFIDGSGKDYIDVYNMKNPDVIIFTFNDVEAFINAKIFNGRSFSDIIPEIQDMCYW